MKCKLCNKSKELKNSHIIPRFLYRFMLKATDGNMTQFDSKLNLWQRSNRQLKKKLFCFDCEQLLSINELEFSKIFKDMNLSNDRNKYIYKNLNSECLNAMCSSGYSKNDVRTILDSSPISTKIKVLEYFSISYVYRELVNNNYNIPRDTMELLKKYLLGEVNVPIMLHVRINTSEHSFNLLSNVIVMDNLDDWKHCIFYLPNMQFHFAICVNGTPKDLSKTIVLPANLYEDEIGSIQIIRNVQKGSKKASNMSQI